MKTNTQVRLILIHMALSATLTSGVIAISGEAKASTQADGTSEAVSAATQSTGALGDVGNLLGQANGAVNQATNVLGQIQSGNIGGAIGSVGGLVGGSTGGAISSIGGALGGLFGGGGSSGPATSPLSGAIQQVLSQVNAALQIIQDPGQLLEQFISPVTNFISEVQDISKTISGLLSGLMGGSGNSQGEMGQAIQGSLGELGLPDPDKIAEILSRLASTDGKRDTTLNQIPPSLREAAVASNANILTGRLSSAQILSQAAQQAAHDQLEQIGRSTEDSKAQSQATLDLASQSQQAGTLSSTAAGTVATAAAAATQSVASAQSRISTQDAIKDLATIAGQQVVGLQGLSDQNSALAAQGAVEAAQLGNISGQVATTNEIAAYQSLQQQQMNTGIAAMNQNTADINEAAQGERQVQIAQQNGATNRFNRLNSQTGLMR